LALMGAAAETALQLDPLLAEAHAAMGLLYSRRLDWQKAEESFDAPMAHAYCLAGRRAEVERLAAAHDDPFRLAVIYAALGDTARAFAALDRAAVTVPHRVGLLLKDPEMAALRGDPRFDAVRAKLGLP
jgi:tetratricopeptide (TPR) repeat protein